MAKIIKYETLTLIKINKVNLENNLTFELHFGQIFCNKKTLNVNIISVRIYITHSNGMGNYN